MQEAWRETARELFWAKLLNERCDMLMSDSESNLKFIKDMRFDNKMVVDYQKRFGEILAQRGTNMYKLIAAAWDENWDSEDEEKQRGPIADKKGSPVNQRNHDNLDSARKSSILEGQGRGHELQSRPQSCRKDLDQRWLQGCCHQESH